MYAHIRRIVLVACVWVCCLGGEQANAWVKDVQLFPEGEVTVVVHRFCRVTEDYSNVGCDYLFSQEEWRSMIQEAISEWNDAGANFTFHTRAVRSNDDPCYIPGEVTVILAEYDNLCPADGSFPSGSSNPAGTALDHGLEQARVYINANHPDSLSRREIRAYLLHEFGHVVGLGHPNKAGQNVEAIMNSRHGYSLQQDDIDGIRALYGTPQPPNIPDTLVGYLENPGDGSSQSGIGIISGWVCDAEEVEIEMTTARGEVLRYEAAYGTERTDVLHAGACDSADVGFGMLFNWNILGDGTHTVRALVDGVELGRARATVTTLYGIPFVMGLTGRYQLEDFPEPGRSVVIEWNQSQQNFVITDIQ